MGAFDLAGVERRRALMSDEVVGRGVDCFGMLVVEVSEGLFRFGFSAL